MKLPKVAGPAALSAAGLCLALGWARPAPATCAEPLAVQVLGSGGPIADDARAGSSYLLWIDGKARLLVDAGAGSFTRFGEAGADIGSLDLIALTHFHTDHAADLPGLLKSGYFSDRKRELPIAGPTGNDSFPGLEEFMRALFAPGKGAFKYLSGYLDGSDGLFHTPLIELDAGAREPMDVFQGERFRVRAVGVHHGIVPALAYLVIVGQTRIAFSGDLNDDNAQFAAMARGADLMVMDHAIPPDSGHVARSLHATPAGIGRLAAKARTGHLLLSHLMARSLARPEASLREIREAYHGGIARAEDLMCIPVGSADADS